MPIIHLKVSGNENAELAQQLVKTITDLTKEILIKKPEVTVVIVSFVPHYLWFVNSQSLSGLKMNSFHLNIKISDSTNIKADKSKYINAVHHVLTLQLIDIHPVSYTALIEMKADAYGFNGETIEYKYITTNKK